MFVQDLLDSAVIASLLAWGRVLGFFGFSCVIDGILCRFFAL